MPAGYNGIQPLNAPDLAWNRNMGYPTFVQVEHHLHAAAKLGREHLGAVGGRHLQAAASSVKGWVSKVLYGSALGMQALDQHRKSEVALNLRGAVRCRDAGAGDVQCKWMSHEVEMPLHLCQHPPL